MSELPDVLHSDDKAESYNELTEVIHAELATMQRVAVFAYNLCRNKCFKSSELLASNQAVYTSYTPQVQLRHCKIR